MLAYITALWNEAIDNYGTLWQIQLVAQPWQRGEEGEISVEACPVRMEGYL
jgi:hypothetical protein